MFLNAAGTGWSWWGEDPPISSRHVTCLTWPLTFGFRLAKNGATVEINGFPEESSVSGDSPSCCDNGNVAKCKGSTSANGMTRMETLVRNNTKDMMQMSLGVTCRDAAEHHCTERNNATVVSFLFFYFDRNATVRAGEFPTSFGLWII